MHVLNNGLNSGFDLDDIQTDSGQELDALLFQDIIPGRVPELKNDLKIKTLTNRLDDLNYLKQDIVKTGGMNRGFAMEAQALIPDFINDHRPALFFTELPTRTQLKATLEAIDKEQKSIVVKIKELEGDQSIDTDTNPSIEKMIDPLERNSGSTKQHFLKLFGALPDNLPENPYYIFEKKDVDVQIVEEMQKHPDLLKIASKWIGDPNKTTVAEMEKLHQVFSSIQKPSRHPKLYRGFKINRFFRQEQQTLELDSAFKNKSELMVGDKFSFVCKKPVSFTYHSCHAAIYGDIIVSIEPDDYYSQLFEMSKEVIYSVSDLKSWKWIKVTEYITECEFILMPSEKSIEFKIESINGKVLLDPTAA